MTGLVVFCGSILKRGPERRPDNGPGLCPRIRRPGQSAWLTARGISPATQLRLISAAEEGRAPGGNGGVERERYFCWMAIRGARRRAGRPSAVRRCHALASLACGTLIEDGNAQGCDTHEAAGSDDFGGVLVRRSNRREKCLERSVALVVECDCNGPGFAPMWEAMPGQLDTRGAPPA